MKFILIFAIIGTLTLVTSAFASERLSLRAQLIGQTLSALNRSKAFSEAYNRRLKDYRDLFRQALETQTYQEFRNLVARAQDDVARNPISIFLVLGSEGQSLMNSALNNLDATLEKEGLPAAKAELMKLAEVARSSGINL